MDEYVLCHPATAVSVSAKRPWRQCERIKISNGRNQRLEVQRLVEDNVSDNACFIIRQRGDHDRRDDAKFRIRPEVSNQVDPTDFGQHQVNQHQGRANAAVEEIKRLLSVVSRENGESLTREQLVQARARIPRGLPR